MLTHSTDEKVPQSGPILKPKASAGTWIVIGISIFLLVVILALGLYIAWPWPDVEVDVQPVAV